MRAPTGTQFELQADTASGPATAVVTEVAAGLRSYAVNGVDLVEPFAVGSTPPKGAGIVLVPWPNRIRDGKWTHNGTTLQLALTEPAKGNASHGLLRYSPYTVVVQTASSVTLEATVFPQAGYPFLIDTRVTYALTDEGLTVTHEVRNDGQDDAPVAIGTHPFFRIGDVPVDDLVLTVRADTHIDVDERMNPVGESPVDGTRFDLRDGRPVRDVDLDDGFAGVPAENGGARHSLTAPDGREVVLWGDENMRYVQVFTPRNFPGLDGSLRTAVAIEPMTAPANAFNTGAGLRWLAPDEQWTVRWGVAHSGF